MHRHRFARERLQQVSRPIAGATQSSVVATTTHQEVITSAAQEAIGVWEVMQAET